MWRIEKRIDIDQPVELVVDYLSRCQFVREWDTSAVGGHPFFSHTLLRMELHPHVV